MLSRMSKSEAINIFPHISSDSLSFTGTVYLQCLQFRRARTKAEKILTQGGRHYAPQEWSSGEGANLGPAGKGLGSPQTG